MIRNDKVVAVLVKPWKYCYALTHAVSYMILDILMELGSMCCDWLSSEITPLLHIISESLKLIVIKYYSHSCEYSGKCAVCLHLFAVPEWQGGNQLSKTASK